VNNPARHFSGDFMRVPASGETYGEARDLHCLLVPAVADYGNARLIVRGAGGIAAVSARHKSSGFRPGSTCKWNRAFLLLV
jgi:hypothetical protein